MKPGIVIVCGSTATGKTDCAIEIAEKFNGEIINADSMQVYKDLDIGTAKPTPEQKLKVPFHLVDVANLNQSFSTGWFVESADRAIEEITSRNRLPIVAGGTGLYLKALVKGIFDGPEADPKLRDELRKQEEEKPGTLYSRLLIVDPEKARSLPPGDTGRIIRALEVYELTGTPLSEHQKEHGFAAKRYRTLWIGLAMGREKLYERINQRVLQMIDAGWIGEVERLNKKGFGETGAAQNALGYRTLLVHVQGEMSLDEASRKIQTDTRKFAKRQATWFRANKDIQWISYPADRGRIFELVDKAVRRWQTSESE